MAHLRLLPELDRTRRAVRLQAAIKSERGAHTHQFDEELFGPIAWLEVAAEDAQIVARSLRQPWADNLVCEDSFSHSKPLGAMNGNE